MTVKEYISNLNHDSVLAGKYAFKVFKEDEPFDKWFFYCDQNENPAKTVEEFCSHDGIKGCMDLEIISISNHGHEDCGDYEKIWIRAVKQTI